MRTLPTDTTLVQNDNAIHFIYSALVEIEWPFEGDTDDPNWSYLNEHANFCHKEACEFILHVGDDTVVDGLNDYARNIINHMRENGCTENFIAAYELAARSGAIRVLFWA